MSLRDPWRPLAIAGLIGLGLTACAGSEDESAFSAAIANEPEKLADVETPSVSDRCTPAPESIEQVATLPPWANGTERHLEVESWREDTSQPEAAGTRLTSARLTLDVNVATGGWNFVWDAGPTTFDESTVTEQLFDEAAPLLAQMPEQLIRYQLDNDRFWLGVDNPDEIRATAVKVAELTAQVAPSDSDLMAQARELYETLPDAEIGLLFSEEPQILHSLEGLELAVGEMIEFSSLLPNALGGDEIPAVTTIEIVDLVDDDGCVAIEMRVIPEPGALGAIMAETLRLRFPDFTDDGAFEAAANSMEIESTYQGQYDFGSGFFRKVTETKRISDASMSRVDTTIITDVTNDGLG